MSLPPLLFTPWRDQTPGRRLLLLYMVAHAMKKTKKRAAGIEATQDKNELSQEITKGDQTK